MSNLDCYIDKSKETFPWLFKMKITISRYGFPCWMLSRTTTGILSVGSLSPQLKFWATYMAGPSHACDLITWAGFLPCLGSAQASSTTYSSTLPRPSHWNWHLTKTLRAFPTSHLAVILNYLTRADFNHHFAFHCCNPIFSLL